MKTYKTIRKPIYIAELTANTKDYPFTTDLVREFVEQNPQFAECKYDTTITNGYWIIKFYKQCVTDFVEE